MIYLITGDGGGKTTSAIGMAVRALGHGKRVVIVQFMKGRLSGEYKFLSKRCTIKLFGAKSFVDLNNPSKNDKLLADKGLKFADQELKKKPFMLILDEVNLAAAKGLVSEDDVLSLLKKSGKTHLVLTGRQAPDSLIKSADIVSVCSDLTSPKKRLPARKGIEY